MHNSAGQQVCHEAARQIFNRKRLDIFVDNRELVFTCERQMNLFLFFFQAIGGSYLESDGCLQRTIDALLSLFSFYHNNFEATLKVGTGSGFLLS